MSAEIITILIVAFVCISLIQSPKNKKKMKRRAKSILTELRSLAIQAELSLSAEEVWRYGALGIDGIEKKLLYLDKFNGEAASHVIELAEIENCTLNVVYRNIDAGDLEYRSIDEFIRTMALRIEHTNLQPGIDIHFYNSRFDLVTDLPELRSKAYRWKRIITQLQENKYLDHV